MEESPHDAQTAQRFRDPWPGFVQVEKRQQQHIAGTGDNQKVSTGERERCRSVGRRQLLLQLWRGTVKRVSRARRPNEGGGGEKIFQSKRQQLGKGRRSHKGNHRFGAVTQHTARDREGKNPLRTLLPTLTTSARPRLVERASASEGAISATQPERRAEQANTQESQAARTRLGHLP